MLILPKYRFPSEQTVHANMMVVAPVDTGVYYLVLTLVQEFEGWFDEMSDDFHPAIIKIVVG